MVTRRQLRLLNREFDIHVRKLKLVNGFKAHNLEIKEKTDTGPLIYIDNPLESRVSHAYMSLEEFRKELEKRANIHREKKSTGKQKQTEVYLQDFYVTYASSKKDNKKDIRRKKVLRSANIFEAKNAKSRYYEHTYTPGLKPRKKNQSMGSHYYKHRNLSVYSNKLLHSINHFNKLIDTTRERKSETHAIIETQDLSNLLKSSSLNTLGSGAVGKLVIQSEIRGISEPTTSLDAHGQTETLELEKTANTQTNTATESKEDPTTVLKLSAMLREKSDLRTNRDHNQVRLLGLSATTTTRKRVSGTINKTHVIPTRTSLRESNTSTITLNVTGQKYINNTIQFKTNNDNKTTNTKGDLAVSQTDDTDTETTTEVNESTTEVDEKTTMTTNNDVTETVMTTEGNETLNDDVTETVKTTKVTVKPKEQPVRPIWMRPRRKKVTTTKTTTTRRTLGVS